MVILILLCCCACRKAQQMELWYWHHSYLTTAESVVASKALIDRAARAGYTGVALWDSSWTFLTMPGWPAENVSKLKEVVDYAVGRGLRVMPVVAPYGHSNDVLKQHPEWAEAQRVIGARFRVDDAGRRLIPVKGLNECADVPQRPLITARVNVEPWRQYHVHLAVRTNGFQGLAQLEIDDGGASRLDANLHPAPGQDSTALDYTFNSAGSPTVLIRAGVFGGHGGELEVSQFLIEETALVYVIRRAGAPLRVYDPDHADAQFEEGRDFDPIYDHKLAATHEFANDNYHDPGPVTIPDGSRLRPGQTVAMDYFAVVPVYDEAVSVCLTDAAVERWMVENTRASAALVPTGSSLLLSHDEIRQMNSCAACRARNLTAGALLAAHTRQLTAKLMPVGPLYIWSDMFDPLHNARDRFYQVEGTISESWKGLPAGVTVMNWNLEHLRNSLVWFSGDDPRQRVAHRQIIAGYYDRPDHDAAAAVREEWAAARGVRGVVGTMYTTWNNDYSQLETFAAAARAEWAKYRTSSPW